jgi:siroheme synthase
MPKKTIGELAARAIASGLPADMPAVAVAAATRPAETIVAGTVADIGVRLAEAAPDGPVLVFIGRVFEGVAARSNEIFSPSEVSSGHARPRFNRCRATLRILEPRPFATPSGPSRSPRRP